MSSPRPGGRSAIVRAKVLAAASELVMEKGAHNVTMPDIAQRARVAATSVYRRWEDVGSLLLDMAADRLADKSPLPDEGSLDADLKRWAGRIADGINSADEPTFLRVLFATSDTTAEKRGAALAPRVAEIEAMLERGRARGEKPPSVNDVIDHLLAPLYLRALIGLRVDRPFAEGLVDRLLKDAG